MSATPDRLNVSRTRLQSPRTPASPAGGSSTVGASRVADSVSNFVALCSKWRTTVEKGNQYCGAIENIKKGVLEKSSELQTDDVNPYPENLKLYCKNLAILNSILEDVVANVGTMMDQLKVLLVLMKEEVVGKSWNLRKVLDVMEVVHGSMKQELDVRKTVAENIGHATSSAELILTGSLWEQLSNLNDGTHLLIRSLEVEFNVVAA